MARLAHYASTSPDEFGRMTPVRAQELDREVQALREADWETRIELAKLSGGAR